MEVLGAIIHIGETETVGASNFRKRLVVVKTNEQYSQEIPIEFVQDKTEMLNNYQVGNEVKVGINLRGNAYNGKWFLSANGWRIEGLQSEASSEPQNNQESDLPWE